MYTKNVQAWIWPHQLLAAILQSMCHVKSKQKLLYSHKFRVPSKKNIAVLIRVFLREKKSADVSYLFTRSQLLISPPLYYTTYISIYSQIKIVWLLHYILPTHVHQVCIKTKPHILLKIIFKWKQSWMIGALIIIISRLFLEVLFLVFLLYYYYKKQK